MMNEKSIKAFGAKSRWQTLMRRPKIVDKVSNWLSETLMEVVMDDLIGLKEGKNVRLPEDNSSGDSKPVCIIKEDGTNASD